MTEHWTDRLSAYLDDELGAADKAALEEHVALCAACRSTLDELRAVLAAAASLEDRMPERDLLPGIMERIGTGDDVTVVPIGSRLRPARRFTFSMPQLAAAATVLMTLTAGSVWLMTRSQAATQPPVTAAGVPVDAAATDDLVAQFVTATVDNYAAAISELESMLADQRDQLNPETIEVIEQNLAVIDAAIAEARSALENDPGRAYLYRHLDKTLNKKVELLKRATSQRLTAT